MSAFLVNEKLPPPVTAPTTALVVPSSTALVVTTPGGELLEVRKLAQTGESKFALVTQNRGGYYGNPPLQRLAAWLEHKVEITKNGNATSAAGVSAAIGGVAGAIAHLGMDVLLVPSIAWGLGAFAVGISALGISHGIKRFAQHEKERAAESLVPLSAIEDMVQRFDEAPAGEKATLGHLLSEWHTRMSSHQALSPEAADALQRVSAENKTLPPDTVARATTLGHLVTMLDAKTAVDSSVVGHIARLIDQLPQADRYDVALTAKRLLEENGRKIDYNGKHALFQMVKSRKP